MAAGDPYAQVRGPGGPTLGCWWGTLPAGLGCVVQTWGGLVPPPGFNPAGAAGRVSLGSPPWWHLGGCRLPGGASPVGRSLCVGAAPQLGCFWGSGNRSTSQGCSARVRRVGGCLVLLLVQLTRQLPDPHPPPCTLVQPGTVRMLLL